MWDLAVVLLLALAPTIYELRGRYLYVGRRRLTPLFVPFDRHVIVLGPTRSGKTRFAKSVASRFRGRVLVLDWNGEYGDLATPIDARLIRIDFERVPKKMLVEVLGLGLGLSDASIYLLYKIVKDVDLGNFDDLVRAVEAYLAVTRAEAEMKFSIIRRLEFIRSVVQGRLSLIDLLTLKNLRRLVIDLSSLVLVEERVIFTSLLLAELYFALVSTPRLKLSDAPKLLIIIDEAQNILNSPLSNIVFRYLAEIAKYGVRVLLVSNSMPSRDLTIHSTVVLTENLPEISGVEWRGPLVMRGAHRIPLSSLRGK